jgi:hypothetical protein
VIREWFGLAALNAVFLVVGTSLLFALGVVRERRAALRFAGLALVTGWVAVAIVCSYALLLGLGLSVLQVVVLSSLMVLCAVLVSRRVPPRARRPRRFVNRRAETVAAWIGFLVFGAYLEVLFLRAQLAEPSRWDTWAFWMPKAMSIVYFDGLDTGPGGFTSFANPDYPPLKPAIDAAGFRFLGDVDPGALAVQNWIVVAAFFGAVAALLADRVRPAILWPSLALLALLPDFGLLVTSLLADESLALLFALAGVCAALWLIEGDVRLIALAALFLSAAALVKNEGLMLALVLAFVLAAVTRLRPWRQLLALAAFPILAVVPWRLWMEANDVPDTSAFRLGDLARPVFLLDRTDRLGAALRELPSVLLAYDRWLLAVPLVLVAAGAVAGRRPALGAYVVGTLVFGVLAFATVYWASTYPLDWYLDTTTDRILSSLVVFGAALFPLLVSEAVETLPPEALPSAEQRARSSAVRAADS